MTEAENEVRRSVSWRGRGMTQNLKFGELPRNGSLRWTRNLIKFEVCLKRDGIVAERSPSVLIEFEV